MHTIKGQVAVITGAAGGIGQALALDMTGRGAAGIALVDSSDRVIQVAREINAEAGHQVAIAYRGDAADSAFREEVYADVTTKAGVQRICVPAAAIIKDSLAVRIDKQTGRVVIYPMEDFRKVVEINMIVPIYWAIELVAAVAKDRGRVHPDQSAAANAVETADQAGGNRGCHLLYGNQRRGELWADAGWRSAR
jgi:3-oxoacyl-[acyl-carrier protein] reductase